MLSFRRPLFMLPLGRSLAVAPSLARIRGLRPTALTLAILALDISAGSAQVKMQSRGGACPPGTVQITGGICVMPVTTIIGDLDANGFAADVASDGLGPYTNGTSSVSSWLTSNGYNGIQYGDWQFDTYSSTARAVSQSLLTSDAVQPGDPHYQAPANPPFWGTELLESHIEVKCTLINNDMLTMTAGSSFTCPLIDRFHASGTDYRLLPAYSWTGYPETTDVQVVCNTVDSGGCNDWFIDPIGLGEAVGRLTIPFQKGNQPPVNDGDFYMRFHIHITRP